METLSLFRRTGGGNDFGFWIVHRGAALLFSLFSRRTGGRLGEEGRGDEGRGGADTATSHHHDPDRRLSRRRLSQAFALIPALALITPYPLLSQPPPRPPGEKGNEEAKPKKKTREGLAVLPLLPADGGEAGRRGPG